MGDRIVTPPNVPVERILYHRSMHDTNLHTEQTSIIDSSKEVPQ